MKRSWKSSNREWEFVFNANKTTRRRDRKSLFSLYFCDLSLFLHTQNKKKIYKKTNSQHFTWKENFPSFYSWEFFLRKIKNSIRIIQWKNLLNGKKKIPSKLVQFESRLVVCCVFDDIRKFSENSFERGKIFFPFNIKS